MQDPAQRRRAGQGPPCLPVRGLARDGQDVDGEDARGVPELRERADGGALRALRVVRRDRQRDVARRHRDGRGVEQLGRRHPRAARVRAVRAGLRALEGLHPRRGAHAVLAGVERVPQDARGAAAAHDLRPRHDRGPEGAADGRRPLPPLRLRAPDRRADRDRHQARRRRGGDRDRPRRRRPARPPRDRLVPRRARHARAARDLHGHEHRHRRRPRRARRRRRRPALRGLRRRRRRRRPRRAGSPPRAWPTPAATSPSSSRTSRPTRATCSSSRRWARCPPELRLTPDRDERLAEQAAARRRAEPRAPARPAGRGPAHRQGRRRRAHAPGGARWSRRPRPRSTPRRAR